MRKRTKGYACYSLNLLVIAFMIALYLILQNSICNKTDTAEPWWVWEIANDIKIESPDSISWEIADNNFVIKAINNKKLKDATSVASKLTKSKMQGDDDMFDNARNKKDLFKTKTLNNKVIPSTETHLLIEKQKPKTILVLSTSETDYNNILIDETSCGKCVVTNKSFKFKKSDAVVFDHEVLRTKEVPARSNEEQIYVWMNRGSVYATMSDMMKQSLLHVDNVFNLTMTHRRDSDIFYPMISTEKLFESLKEDNNFLSLSELLRIKSKLIYWKSMCCGNNRVHRMGLDIVYRLHAAGLKMTDLEGCGVSKQTFPNHFFPPEMYHKFYLALGSDYHCRDVISKDVWQNGLLMGVVPVIWGPKNDDVLNILPKGSYIHADEFISPFELINYLEYLDRDDDAYREYLKWREDIEPGHHSRQPKQLNGFCQLCFKLHNRHNNSINVIPSLYKWWLGDEHVNCLNPPTPYHKAIELVIWLVQVMLLYLENKIYLITFAAVYSQYLYYIILVTSICFVYKIFPMISMIVTIAVTKIKKLVQYYWVK